MEHRESQSTHGISQREQKTRKDYLTRFFILFTFCLIFITACNPTSPDVTFMVFGDPAEFAAYQSLVERFEAVHSDIDIQLEHIPSQGDYRQKLAARFASGTPPDVMLLNYRRFASFAEAGALEPLGPYLLQSDVIAAEDFFPIAIDAFRFEEQLWCIPQNVSSLVVYFNKTLFDASGVSYPGNDWTRTDFLETARALTLDSDGDGVIDQYGVGIDPSIFRLAPFFWQDNLEIVDNPDHPTKLTLDIPTLQWVVDLQVKERVIPSAEAEAAQDSESRFLNGSLAMLFNSRRGVPTYRTIEDFEWDVAPLPLGQRAAGILHSDAYCLAAKSENMTDAWTFIEFANSAEGQTLVAATGRTVPSLTAVANSPAFLDPDLPPANGRIFIETVPFLRTVPIMANWVTIEELASKEIERAFYGQVSTEEAAAAAVQQTEKYFRE